MRGFSDKIPLREYIQKLFISGAARAELERLPDGSVPRTGFSLCSRWAARVRLAMRLPFVSLKPALQSRSLWVLGVLALISLPLSVLAITRLTGWEWWPASAAALVGGLIPFVGIVGNLGLSLLGAYYVVDADFDWRRAAGEPPAVLIGGEASGGGGAVEGVRVSIRDEVQRRCWEEARRRGIVNDSTGYHAVTKYCGCAARVSVTALTAKDWREVAAAPESVPAEFPERIASAVADECRLR